MMITNRDIKYMNVAKAVAHTSNCKFKLGCAVVNKNTILSVATNSEKTHTRQMKYNANYKNFDTSLYPNKLHAEVNAINHILNMRYDINWKDITIYVYREDKKGKPACSRPCPACFSLIRDLGIGSVVYIDLDGLFRKDKVKDMIKYYN